jgi:carbonic anhydrase
MSTIDTTGQVAPQPTQVTVTTTCLRKSQDIPQEQIEELTQAMPSANMPYQGQNLDVQA